MDPDRQAHPETRLLLVDDHVSIREALASVFDKQPDFSVRAQASTRAQALSHMRGIDVALVDLGLGDGSGIDLIPALRRQRPPVQVLVLTSATDRASLAAAVERGAAAVLNKSLSLEEVVGAVRKVRAGQTLLPQSEIFALVREAGANRARDRAERKSLELLTNREREVLAALAAGLDTQAIAAKLFISVRTERNHVAHILSKLDVRSQLQAVLLALRHGAVTLDSLTDQGPLGSDGRTV